MADHPNVAYVRNMFAAFERADLAEIQTAIPNDAVWHFPGRSGKLAGSHRGREAILSFLMNVAGLTGGSFHLEIEDVLADDNFAVALFRGHGTRNGRTLDNPTSLKMRFDKGQIVELWEFVWDLYAVDDFWS